MSITWNRNMSVIDLKRKRLTLHFQTETSATLELQQDEGLFSPYPATSPANGNAAAQPTRNCGHLNS